ncbi:MAG: ATP-dependent sacrificial sulfur transferase LarE [Gemmatimonadota bacterium]|nr:MAG: ATP-dependent sacrificial sulfur transferase LarE [Gemmatimonadota bacterium]
MELATIDLATKKQALDDRLGSAGSALIAYSGGVDSAFLAKAAVDALGGERVLAVTGRSPSYSEAQHRIAVDVARSIGLRHEEIETSELDDPDYAANPADRCYFCKTELFRRLVALAQERGYAAVFDGTNADDVHDHRPGRQAARELGVRSPLQEAGLTKAEIRALSRAAGLPGWDLPASPCLASRIPHGIRVTPQRLRQVEDAEARLQALHRWRDLRVRYHGDLARIEVPAVDLPLFGGAGFRAEVLAALQAAGFDRVCVDLAGYRRGSLNGEVGDGGRPPDERAREMTGERLLAEAGVGATLEAAGARGELALVMPHEAPTSTALGSLSEIADDLARRAGFKHVALAL